MNYILKDNEPIICEDVMEWAEWYSKTDNRIIEKTKIKDVEISTVFLGIDHNYSGGEPILYETMIFGLADEYQVRYNTLEQAKAGHRKSCECVALGTPELIYES